MIAGIKSQALLPNSRLHLTEVPLRQTPAGEPERYSLAHQAIYIISGIFGIEITCQVVDHFQYPTDLHEVVIEAVEMGSSAGPEPARPCPDSARYSAPHLTDASQSSGRSAIPPDGACEDRRRGSQVKYTVPGNQNAMLRSAFWTRLWLALGP